jgi:serine/threonine-protein phosphatase 2A catalytic subunit
MRKYGNAVVWKCFTDLFDLLPLAAVVGGSVFCVHAGLSYNIETIYDINAVDRKEDISQHGTM